MPKLLDALFGKKPPHFTREETLSRLNDCQQRGDAPGLVRNYYAMGVDYMERGDPERALLYLNRAEVICNARDDTFERVPEELMDDCSRRIGELEDAPILINRIQTQVEERALALEEKQVRLWGLLTLARFCVLGKRLSALPGCAILESLDRVTEVVFQSLHGPIDAADVNYLGAFYDLVYTMGDSESFTDLRQQVEVPGNPPFQLFDMCGMLTLTELSLYLDSHLTLLSSGLGASEAETGLISCALLPDYHLRTREGDIGALPQVKAELERIWGDWEFVRVNPPREAVAERLATYRTLDVLA